MEEEAPPGDDDFIYTVPTVKLIGQAQLIFVHIENVEVVDTRPLDERIGDKVKINPYLLLHVPFV